MAEVDTIYFDAGGQTIAIPVDRQDALARAQELGLRQITDLEASKRKFTREYQDSIVAPLALGAAKGLTFGTAPGLLTKAGILEPGEAAGIEEAAPILTTGAEIGTGIAAVLATGGTGAAAQVAGRVTAKEAAKRILAGAAAPTRKLAEAATAAGRVVGARAAATPAGTKAAQTLQSTVQAVAPLAIAGTIEGAVYGAGTGLSEAIVQNPEATAEDILSSAANGAVSGATYGGLFGGGIGAAAQLIKGGTNIASNIYRDSVDKHGQKFAERVAEFITSADPQAREFVADELQQIISFQRSYSGLTDAIRAAEERIADIKQRGLDEAAERAQIGVVKSQLQEQIRQLDSRKSFATKAVSAIQKTLKGLAKRTSNAAQKGIDEFMGEAEGDLRALGETRQELAEMLGEVSKRGEGFEQVTRETAGDAALKDALDEAVQLDPKVPGLMQQGANEWVEETILRINALSDDIADKAVSDFFERNIRTVRKDLEKINQAFDEGDYFQAFILQRQLRRNLNRLPNAFRRLDEVPEVAKNKFNELINAIQPANTYTRFVGETAQGIENAKNIVQSNLIKMAELGKASASLSKLPGYVETIRDSGAKVVEAIRNTPELARDYDVAKVVQRFSDLVDSVGKKSEALSDYQQAIEGMRQVLGLGVDFDADTIQQIIEVAEESGVPNVIGQKFDDAIADLQKYADRIDDPDALAVQIEELKQKKAQEKIKQDIIAAEFKKAKAAFNRDESVSLANIDKRSKELAADAFAGGALLDLLIGGMIPNFLSYGALAYRGVKFLKENPTAVLKGTAGILAAGSKVNNQIRNLMQKTLKAVSLDDFDSVKYQRKGSILGKMLGQTVGIVSAPYQTPTDEDYKKSVAKIKELQSDQTRMLRTAERAASGGQNVQALRDALGTTTIRAINYLGTFTPELIPLSPFDRYEPVPTPELKMRYATAIEVINNPIGSYYYALSRNLLDQQVLEPLRAIYPDLYTRLQQETVSTFVENRAVLPYATRVQFGLAYGQGMDPTVAPQFVGTMQQLYSPAGQEQPGGVNMTQGGVGQLRKSAAAFQTPGQRMMEA